MFGDITCCVRACCEDLEHYSAVDADACDSFWISVSS